MNTMRIQGISLSEFNDKTGFQLIMRVPEHSILTQQQFNLCSDLILPREQLCQRIIAIQYKRDYFLLGMPSLSINKPYDKRYAREKYIYSVSILINKKDYLQMISKQNLYKQIIRKIAYYFKFLQESYHLIYDHKSSQDYIKKLLWKIFQDINVQKRCFLNHLCSHFTFINLNYSPIGEQNAKRQIENDQIKDCQIPTTNLTLDQIQNHIQSELGKTLLKYAYEGQYTMKKIYDLHKQSKTQIRQFYKKATYRGLVFFVDMFSLNNTYILTHKIHQYIGETSDKVFILSEIKKAVALDNQQQFDQNQLLFLYCQFNRLMALSKIVAQHKSLFQRINILKFVRIGVILGILKRVHQHIFYYEICPYFNLDEIKKFYKKRQGQQSNLKNRKFMEQQQRRLNDLLMGHLMNNDTVDQICVSLEIDYDNLLKMITQQNRQIFAFPEI